MKGYRLMYEFAHLDPETLVAYTYRVLRCDGGDLKYLNLDTGEVKSLRHLLPLKGFQEAAFEIPVGADVIPFERLPVEVAEIRYCRECGRYSYYHICPYCRALTFKCVFYI